MEQKQFKKIIYASEAKADAEAAQKENLEKAIDRIQRQAKLGFEEVLLFGIWLNLQSVQKLMELGYNVTVITHPIELVKMYKISW